MGPFDFIGSVFSSTASATVETLGLLEDSARQLRSGVNRTSSTAGKVMDLADESLNVGLQEIRNELKKVKSEGK